MYVHTNALDLWEFDAVATCHESGQRWFEMENYELERKRHVDIRNAVQCAQIKNYK